MKEPVLFKTKDTLPNVDRQELVVPANEKRFAFLELKNASGLSEAQIEVKDGAQLEVVLLQNVASDLEIVSHVRLKAGRDSHVKFTFVQNGGKRAHIELETEVLGSGANVEIRGLQNAKASQKHSFEARSRHAVPHTRSDLQVWCIASDESHSIFNGTITIAEGAHHTEAFQRNKNLLLSDRAVIDTFPKLYIWNDDVKCAHGSSVSQLEPEQFYYLQARGIDATEAEKILLAGFIHQAFEWIGDEAAKIKLENIFGIEEEAWSN